MSAKFIQQSGWYLLGGVSGKTIKEIVNNNTISEYNAEIIKENIIGKDRYHIYTISNHNNVKPEPAPAPGYMTVDQWSELKPDTELLYNIGFWVHLNVTKQT
jgi:hypothetical protein